MNSLYDTDSGNDSAETIVEFSDDQYSQLKLIANGLVRREMSSTLTATGLVHEWFLKLAKSRLSSSVASITFAESPNFRFASRNMKQILIDRARSRISRKNSEKNSSYSLIDESTLRKIHEADKFIVALGDAVSLMQESMPENANLVRLRVLEGKSIEEAAEILGLARATAFRKWSFCKTWLASRLDAPA
ncbi:ECF-type sigma factor [bacterium]|jgi:RNA polymerase sigma factor (TIGR02999 family)|nr:ECF-type sigma factor [bacterium]